MKGLKVGWIRDELPNGCQIIHPANDRKQHDIHSLDCCCNPIVDPENSLLIHNSFDCREAVEEAEDILKL